MTDTTTAESVTFTKYDVRVQMEQMRDDARAHANNGRPEKARECQEKADELKAFYESMPDDGSEARAEPTVEGVAELQDALAVSEGKRAEVEEELRQADATIADLRAQLTAALEQNERLVSQAITAAAAAAAAPEPEVDPASSEGDDQGEGDPGESAAPSGDDEGAAPASDDGGAGAQATDVGMSTPAAPSSDETGEVQF